MTTPRLTHSCFTQNTKHTNLHQTGTMKSRETPGGGLSLDVRGPVDFHIDTDLGDEASAIPRDAPA